MPIIFLDSPGNAIAGMANAAPAPAVSFTNSRRLSSGFSADGSFRKRRFADEASLAGKLHRLAQIFSQRQAAIVVELLMARPTHGIAHAFDFNLRAEFQSFELRPLRQNELRLANLPGQGIARVEATALQNFSILAFDGDPQDARDAGDAVVCEADDEAEIAGVFVAPDKRRPHAITDAPIDAVKGGGIRLIVGLQVFRVDLMEIPKRPVIRADIHHMRNHIFGRRYTFDHGCWIGRLAWYPLLKQRSDP